MKLSVKSVFGLAHRYVSPVFIVLLVASFVLWYLAKLNYTYTTEQTVEVSVDGQKVSVCCIVEGLGTNLLGYRINGDKHLSVPLSELKYSRLSDEELPDYIELDRQSLHDAIATRCSDIKVISIKGGIPPIPFPRSDK